MKKPMEAPHPDNDPDHNEWLENQIHTEVDKDIKDDAHAFGSGSFKQMAEVERRLQRKKD